MVLRVVVVIVNVGAVIAYGRWQRNGGGGVVVCVCLVWAVCDGGVMWMW